MGRRDAEAEEKRVELEAHLGMRSVGSLFGEDNLAASPAEKPTAMPAVVSSQRSKIFSSDDDEEGGIFGTRKAQQVAVPKSAVKGTAKRASLFDDDSDTDMSAMKTS